MKTAIIYATNHGTTEKIVHEIKKNMGSDEVQLINIKSTSLIDLSIYDLVIIGGSIHAGNIQRKIKLFCNKYLHQLLEKRLALFITCFYDGEIAFKQIENAYPELLRKNAISVKIFKGEMLVDKMNFFEKLIVKKVAGISENISHFNKSEIIEFVECLKNNF